MIPCILVLMTLASCSSAREEADLILTGGKIYTVDAAFSTAEAMAIRDGRILATGTDSKILKTYHSEKVVDLEDSFVYPGWIDAHCHFFGYGMNLNAVDVAGTESVEEIIVMLKEHAAKHPGLWITGRGWDQNDWEVKEFPHKSMLDEHFPDRPILLRRIDGHAAWANSKALELAEISAKTKVDGGTVMVMQGEPSGILVDNAIGLVGRFIPAATDKEIITALREAQENCFAVGLTSVNDAGLSAQVVELIHQQHENGKLKIRINAWLSPSKENFSRYVEKGPWQTEHLSVNTIKLFADGALGSRGALMIEDYSDDPGNRGLQVSSNKELEQHMRRAYENNFAVATHCIGDGANRLILELYSDILGGKNDRRWRVEHSQIIAPEDFHYFGDFNIVPSVQTTHATSDMYWAEERVGPERIIGAYAYKQLLEENGWLPNGSDFPVEYINPLFGFYAGVARMDQQGWPEGGWHKENGLSREEAMRAMTIWAAVAGFEEDLKGSLESGKLADFVITRKDLMTAPEKELFSIEVESTWSGGEKVYSR